MRIGARLTGAEFTLFSGLGAARGTTNRQRLFPGGFHDSIMLRFPAGRCSILTTEVEK
jgi:hypothetical protein